MGKIIACSILIGVLVLAGCTNTEQNQNAIIEDNKVLVSIDGYRESCASGPAIFVYENGSWRKANTQLPGKGMYFLDGEYRGYGMCDHSVCNKIENPLKINLVEYAQVGKRESLETKGYYAPEFNTIKLNGKIKVELDYYADSHCGNKKTFTKTADN